MGFGLENYDQKGVDFSCYMWTSLLSIGRAFGWEPLGTIKYLWKDNATGEIDEFRPQNATDADGLWFVDSGWDGGYGSNCAQEIRAEDANNFADALERFYIDVVNFSESNINSKKILSEQEEVLLEWSAPAIGELLVETIAVLRGGPCRIF